jgi:hypothetical protein
MRNYRGVTQSIEKFWDGENEVYKTENEVKGLIAIIENHIEKGFQLTCRNTESGEVSFVIWGRDQQQLENKANEFCR